MQRRHISVKKDLKCEIRNYIYIVGVQSDLLVRVYYSRTVTANDIWLWHKTTYSKNSLGIFAFQYAEDAIDAMVRQFSQRMFSSTLFKCSFEEMRLALLVEQRRQNGLRIPMFISLNLWYRRFLGYWNSLIGKSEDVPKKYLHDDAIKLPFEDMMICSEGFTN